MSFAKNMRKTISKYSSDTIHEGFYESDLWVDGGNMAMNKLMSGSFFKGFPYHKTTVIGGESGSGKSLVAATSAMNAQKDLNAVVVWLDAEKASKREWLETVGLDTSEEKFLYLEVATISDVKKIVSGIVKELKATPEDKRENVFIVVDSYTFLMTDKEMEEAVKGDVVGDQGQHAKQVKNLIKSITHLISRVPVIVVGMVHSMASGDKYEPDEILTGGRGLQYAASLVMAFTKLKMKAELVEDTQLLKDEYDDNKKIVGIRCVCKIYKSRFAKPNERVEVQIPWGKGIDPFSGTFELLKQSGIIKNPSVGWYSYEFSTGEEIKFRKSEYRQHAISIMRDVDGLSVSFDKDDTPLDILETADPGEAEED